MMLSSAARNTPSIGLPSHTNRPITRMMSKASASMVAKPNDQRNRHAR